MSPHTPEDEQETPAPTSIIDLSLSLVVQDVPSISSEFQHNGIIYSKSSAKKLAAGEHLNTDAVHYCLNREFEMLDEDIELKNKIDSSGISIVHDDKLHSLRQKKRRSPTEKAELYRISTSDFIVLPYFDIANEHINLNVMHRTTCDTLYILDSSASSPQRNAAITEVFGALLDCNDFYDEDRLDTLIPDVSKQHNTFDCGVIA